MKRPIRIGRVFVFQDLLNFRDFFSLPLLLLQVIRDLWECERELLTRDIHPEDHSRADVFWDVATSSYKRRIWTRLSRKSWCNLIPRCHRQGGFKHRHVTRWFESDRQYTIYWFYWGFTIHHHPYWSQNHWDWRAKMIGKRAA